MTREARQAARDRCDSFEDTAFDILSAADKINDFVTDGKEFFGSEVVDPLMSAHGFLLEIQQDLPAALDALDAAEARIAELAHFERRWAEAVRETAERDAENARLTRQLALDRSRWADAQNRLAEIETNLNNFLGTQQGIVDSIEYLFSAHRENARLRAALGWIRDNGAKFGGAAMAGSADSALKGGA